MSEVFLAIIELAESAGRHPTQHACRLLGNSDERRLVARRQRSRNGHEVLAADPRLCEPRIGKSHEVGAAFVYFARSKMKAIGVTGNTTGQEQIQC